MAVVTERQSYNRYIDYGIFAITEVVKLKFTIVVQEHFIRHEFIFTPYILN